jgi:precorrin-2 dehydrogenase/sirohydrochlorin ferrochelatase
MVYMMITLLLDLQDKNVIIFGGGTVGLRKARFFEGESKVTVVSREFHPDFESICVRKIIGDVEELAPDMVSSSDIVIAATDDQSLNNRISEMAKSLGKLHNQANGIGNFLIPSVLNRGSFTVAISTMGKSPAFSRYLRLKLERELSKELELMVQLQEELRAELKERIEDQQTREDLLRLVLYDDRIWTLLSNSYQDALNEARRLTSEVAE